MELLEKFRVYKMCFSVIGRLETYLIADSFDCYAEDDVTYLVNIYVGKKRIF